MEGFHTVTEVFKLIEKQIEDQEKGVTYLIIWWHYQTLTLRDYLISLSNSTINQFDVVSQVPSTNTCQRDQISSDSQWRWEYSLQIQASRLALENSNKTEIMLATVNMHLSQFNRLTFCTLCACVMQITIDSIHESRLSDCVALWDRVQSLIWHDHMKI